jgi:hypothetical protein
MKKFLYSLLALPMLLVACGEGPDVPVEEPKKPTLELKSAETMEFEAEGGEGVISFAYNIKGGIDDFESPNSSVRMLSVACNAEWIDVPSSVETFAGSFRFTVAKNENEEPREATITASLNEYSFVVTVKQAAAENGGGNEGGDDPVVPAEDPSIVWDKHDISKREPIVAGLEVDLLVSASKGIKEFLVEIRSASLTPEELAGTGLCNVLNICYPTQSYDSRNPGVFIDVEEPLRGLGFAVGSDVVNKTFVKLSITQFMGVLQAVSGSDLKNHDFVITVTDNEGNTTVKTLMLQTGN